MGRSGRKWPAFPAVWETGWQRRAGILEQQTEWKHGGERKDGCDGSSGCTPASRPKRLRIPLVSAPSFLSEGNRVNRTKLIQDWNGKKYQQAAEVRTLRSQKGDAAPPEISSRRGPERVSLGLYDPHPRLLAHGPHPPRSAQRGEALTHGSERRWPVGHQMGLVHRPHDSPGERRSTGQMCTPAGGCAGRRGGCVHCGEMRQGTDSGRVQRLGVAEREDKVIGRDNGGKAGSTLLHPQEKEHSPHTNDHESSSSFTRLHAPTRKINPVAARERPIAVEIEWNWNDIGVEESNKTLSARRDA
ncbi:hypothetical protein K438DRAFT_1933031 [Mycena galopus ATCC 62051]|nr:hypothetical protein K438DRAFT_1933031 [Mycena galopus ATCC 62051]